VFGQQLDECRFGFREIRGEAQGFPKLNNGKSELALLFEGLG
jgi:hypothetical protein